MSPAPPADEQLADDAIDSGWLRVESRSRSRRGNRQPRRSQADALDIKPVAARTAPLRPVPEIEADYRKLRSQWHQSTAHTSLCRIVDAISSAAPKITSAICLGIGSFDPADGAWEAKKTAFVQFIAFETMISQLEKELHCSISCFFQEPLFTDSDKQFIQGMGHKVVDSPKGSDMVESSTLVFGIHLYRPLYAQALRNSLPAVFVGTGWPVWDRMCASNLDDLHNLEKMEHTYPKLSFLTDCFGNAFSDTSIYWQPSQSARSEQDEGQIE